VLQPHVIRRALPLLLILALVPATADAAVTKKKAIAGPVEFDGESQFPTYAALGAGIYVATLDRGKIAVMEPENAKDPDDPGYAWPPELDEAVSEAAKYHIQIAFTIKGEKAGFATAAARRFPTVRLWQVEQGSTSNGSYTSTLKAAYTELKARSKQNKVIAHPRAAKAPKAKFDLFGYTPSAKKKLPDLKKLHDAVDTDLFITGWTLDTAGSAAAKTLTAAFKAVKKASYVYTLGYDGLYDTGEVGSDGRIPKTGLLANDGTKRPAYEAFRRG
jgi:hypothetical protein